MKNKTRDNNASLYLSIKQKWSYRISDPIRPLVMVQVTGLEPA